MKKIAIIATTKDAFIFNLIGVEEISVAKTTKDAETLVEKYNNKDYAIVFIENNIFEKIKEKIPFNKNNKTPIFAALPNFYYIKNDSSSQSLTYKTIKKIVGTDIKV